MVQQGTGRLGHGAVPGLPIEGYLFSNWAHGAFVTASTTGSSQITGTGNGTFLYDLTDGVAIVDGTALNIKAAADQACEAAGDILDDGQSVIYTIIAWKHPTSGVVAVKSHRGTIATTGSQVEATIAEIEAGLPANAKFIKLGLMTIARTGAEVVTESQDASVRATGVAA